MAEIKAYYPQLEVCAGDALKFGWNANAAEEGKSHIISNLPYNISVVLLTGWLEMIESFKSLTLMFQKRSGGQDFGRYRDERVRAVVGDGTIAMRCCQVI